MTRIILSLLLLIIIVDAQAQCPIGKSEVIVFIQPDSYPNETSWSLKNNSGAILMSGAFTGDTMCVDSGACLIFEMEDTYGDGICCGFGNGFYSVSVNGVIQAAGGQFTFSEVSYVSCPAGSNCGSAFTVYQDSVNSSISSSTWYEFTPDTTGTFNVSTCFPANTCDTRVWIYDHCTNLVWNNANAGTLYYNDSACGLQAFIAAGLQAGQTYYIRIGGDTSCTNDTITWQITYGGPIVGCTDPAACNYNPLATVNNNICIYPGDPNCNSGPDLVVDGAAFSSSLTVGVVNGNDVCLIGEGCLSGYGARDVINFTTRIANIGDADYYIGQPQTGNTQFVFDQCHGHWHYAGYAQYDIYDSLGVPMQAGFKNGFCVMDLQCFGGVAKYGCGDMGISAACADIYGAGLACQWLDITNIPAGRYTMVIRVNWDQDPDALGRQEQRFDNNVAAVCVNITRDTLNVPSFTVLPNCQPLIDCAGDTFGLAVYDCMGNCNGTRVRGDLDLDTLQTDTDINLYMTDITSQNAVSPCNDLNGDNSLTVTDVALLSGCIRSQNGSHNHQGGTQNTHRHCEFPWNILNINDTVKLGIGAINTTAKYLDLQIANADCRLLGLDFTMTGLQIDSVVSIYPGFEPLFQWNATTGRIIFIDSSEVSLTKQIVPVNFLRVYYSSLSSSTICIAQLNASVNSDYEETNKVIYNGCVSVTGNSHLYKSGILSIVPNPSKGIFRLKSNSLQGQVSKVSIVDVMGKVVMQEQEISLDTDGMELDLSHLPSGMYLVNFKSEGIHVIERLVIE